MAGCRDRYKDVVEQQTANFAEFASVLRDVKDKASMDAAEDRLASRAATYLEASRQAKGLGPPDAETLERLASERKKMQTAVEQIAIEANRIKGLPGGPEFLDRVNELMGGAARGPSQ